ncbi:GPR75 protein, partial [Copsychus sechellarum]|nr:GPR75 protein [Copsychus sechellarum]
LREGTHAATLAACAGGGALVFCLGSYGNLIVLLSFFDPALRKFRTDFDFMILNGGGGDLFICGVAAPMFAFVLGGGPARGVPGAFCFTFHLTRGGGIIMSLKTVAVIALHRLGGGVGKQPHRAASAPCSLLLTLLLWAASFTLATLATLRTRGSRLCLPMASPPGGQGKLIGGGDVTDFICCVAVVSVCYVGGGQALRRNARARQGPPAVGGGGPRAQPFAGPELYRTQSGGGAPHGHNKLAGRLPLASAGGGAAGKDSKAVVTCVVIVRGGGVCCLPLAISLVQDVLSGGGGFVLYQFELCGFTLIFLGGGLNPFIYSRNSAGLRRRGGGGLQYAALVFFCCKHKTRGGGVGKGSLEVNRNKSSHHEGGGAYMLSPKPQKKGLEQVGGGGSKDSVLSPRASAGQQHGGGGSSTPMNTRVEPYYSV